MNSYKGNIKIILDLLKNLPNYRPMINSKEIDISFDYIKKKYLKDAQVHEFKPNSKAGDWVVPKRWKLNKAYIKSKNNTIIASNKISKLFVSNYSQSVDGHFTKDEIRNHLFTREDKKNSYLLEHRNTYNFNLNDWNITLPNKVWSQMSDKEKYHIHIDTSLTDGNMKVLEYTLEGKSKKTFYITAHIDELCNDNLSGCALGVSLFCYLSKLKKRKYTYMLILAAELFGFVFYLNKIKKNIYNSVGMLNLETIGAGKNWCLKKSIRENIYIENILKNSFKSNLINFKEINFFDGYVNDEKIFSWPNIGVESIGLQRFPFNEYHTDDDTFKIIDSKLLEESFLIVEKFIKILENDFVPKFKTFLPPWLSKRNLYFDYFNDKYASKYSFELLYSIDGIKTLSSICLKLELDFFKAEKYLNNMIDQGILEKNELILNDLKI